MLALLKGMRQSEVKSGEGPLGDGGRELALTRPLSSERVFTADARQLP